MSTSGAVYLLTNKYHTAIYVGATTNLLAGIVQHKTKKNPESITAQRDIDKLVYYEKFDSPEEARARRQQIMNGSWLYKVRLINHMNPGWCDLFEEVKAGEE